MIVIRPDQQLSLAFLARGKMEQSFWDFHERHPHVYETLKDLAIMWRRHRGGKSRLGIAALFERARWELALMRYSDEGPPKLNNNNRAFYARLLMEKEPELEGMFSLRNQRIESTIGPSKL
jgi:hypothetical protein